MNKILTSLKQITECPDTRAKLKAIFDKLNSLTFNQKRMIICGTVTSLFCMYAWYIKYNQHKKATAINEIKFAEEIKKTKYDKINMLKNFRKFKDSVDHLDIYDEQGDILIKKLITFKNHSIFYLEGPSGIILF